MNCVYFHINSSTKEIFYVGIGSTKRPYSDRDRNKWWQNTVKKYGYEAKIIHENLSWKEACELEKKYIKEIGRRDKGLGPLVNLTDGADGVSNPSEEVRLKMSKTHKGKILSEETRKKMSKKRTLQHRINIGLGQLGKHKHNGFRSDEVKEKIRNSKKGKPWTEARRLAQNNHK